MEPITYMFSPVNRNVVGIKPKQPLLDWINAIYPDMAEDGSETSAYLVKEHYGYEEIEKWLKKNFAQIFENELNERHQNEDDWPKKLTWKLFTEWFDASIYAAVYDIEKGPVRKALG